MTVEARNTSEVDQPLERRVLVVDDEPLLRNAAGEYLSLMRGEFIPEYASDGEEALAMVRKRLEEGEPFAAIITDFQMPHINGLEFAQQVRVLEQELGLPATPIALNTSAIVSTDQAQKSGVTMVLREKMEYKGLKAFLDTLP